MIFEKAAKSRSVPLTDRALFTGADCLPAPVAHKPNTDFWCSGRSVFGGGGRGKVVPQEDSQQILQVQIHLLANRIRRTARELEELLPERIRRCRSRFN